VVHEANPKPGLANRLGARFTTHVFTGHPDTQLRNGKYIGIPIRARLPTWTGWGWATRRARTSGCVPTCPCCW
jgi:UDP-N-acetylglucosamine:LPS N-acetylglucosamine transferase